ncbi:DnaJ domain protein [Klosneuvirus KNV1]|uniref:DnaJ domain protein n=1 Tax=Klosneuvirus KNV1 TaxID=1977640 RepID=A0A1V0SHM7_9VIRU|nr:DnaJ domain protein [Klosneuvirus KNV1]
MSTVNLYDVLDVSPDCDIKDIKTSYKKLVIEFHPDKMGGDAEMFELITHAYNILVNPSSRAEYDEMFALSKQINSNHFDLKNKSKSFYDAVEKDNKLKKKEVGDSKVEFKKVSDDLDRKHGYKREKEYEGAITDKNTKQRLRDLELAREQDDIENIQEKIFDNGRFDIGKFNAAFDVIHKGHQELIPHQGNPHAFSLGSDFGSSFSPVDNYDKLYAEDDDTLGTTFYSSIKLNSDKNKNITIDDIDTLIEAEYTKKHNYKDKTYTKSLEERMKERELETLKLNDRGMQDFDTDVNCGGYGIFDQVKSKTTGNLTWDDEEDVKLRYQRLLELRKNDMK